MEEKELKEALILAGKLSISCECVLKSDTLNLSDELKYMKEKLSEYNYFIINHM